MDKVWTKLNMDHPDLTELGHLCFIVKEILIAKFKVDIYKTGYHIKL